MVTFGIISGEFDIVVHRVEVFSKCLHLFNLDFDKCVVHISVPVARNCSSVEIQILVFYFPSSAEVNVVIASSNVTLQLLLLQV